MIRVLFDYIMRSPFAENLWYDFYFTIITVYGAIFNVSGNQNQAATVDEPQVLENAASSIDDERDDVGMEMVINSVLECLETNASNQSNFDDSGKSEKHSDSDDDWEFINSVNFVPKWPINAVNLDHRDNEFVHVFPLIPGKGVSIMFRMDVCKQYAGEKFTSDFEDSVMKVSGVVYDPKEQWYSELISVTRWAIQDTLRFKVDFDVESILSNAEWLNSSNAEDMRKKHVEYSPNDRFWIEINEEIYYYTPKRHVEEDYGSEEENGSEEEDGSEEDDKSEWESTDEEEDTNEEDANEENVEYKEMDGYKYAILPNPNYENEFCEMCRRLRAFYRENYTDCDPENNCHLSMQCSARPQKLHRFIKLSPTLTPEKKARVLQSLRSSLASSSSPSSSPPSPSSPSTSLSSACNNLLTMIIFFLSFLVLFVIFRPFLIAFHKHPYHR